MNDTSPVSPLDIRVGTIVSADRIENAKYSTHLLMIDFGPDIGVKKSCARLIHYQVDQLPGKQVLGVINLPPRQIGKHLSQVLTLGVPGPDNECVLITPDQSVPIGGRLY